MKKWTKLCLTLGIMLLVSLPVTVPSYVIGWRQDTSSNLERPNFATHQWLAYEALQISPSTSMLQWIENNRLYFWWGVEAPYNELAAEQVSAGLGVDYGDIYDYVLYLDAAGTTVTNDSLADRAQEEYDKLIAELGDVNGDYALAAFYAGAMSHYISQAGVYAAQWDESLWGTLNVVNWTGYENQIEATLIGSHFENDPEDFNSTEFNIEPTAITPVNASQATIDLAMNIWSFARSLGDDFVGTWTSVDDWTATYKDNTLNALEYSAEAIYAAIKHALEAVNWKYLSIPDPTFTYYADTNHIAIPEFEVTYTDNTGSYILTDLLATKAEFRVIAEGQYITDPWTMQPDINQLYYNDATDKWYYPDELFYGTVAKRDHTILYTFDLDGGSETWSNSTTATFAVDYYFVNVTSLDSYYNWRPRTLDIWNVQFEVPDLPDVGIIDNTEATDAEWILYTKGEGTQVGEAIGVPAYNTEGDAQGGELYFNSTDSTWYSLDNDIGLVFTQTLQQYYVVVKMTITGLPVGYEKTSSIGQTEFVPYAQGSDDYWFVTRDHVITMTKPEIVFHPEDNTVDVYGIRGWADYGNTSLDYYELVDKEVYGQDIRSTQWKVFLFDGIQSRLTGELTWDYTEEYWYVEGIDLNSLPDNDYYIAAKLVNMNLNATVSPWGPQSDLFTISRPIPIVYWILPEIFLAGFVVLFGWLIWWRPRQKKIRIEREREEKIDKGYLD